jgi:hypothetical protein
VIKRGRANARDMFFKRKAAIEDNAEVTTAVNWNKAIAAE